ncbi:hypothetical protein [Halobellus rufus]|uniref:hypothetical protein n=1 Tax=Halobellus rufus TaxID=1448860 RepID=UPI0006795465|nr:hypothetical protein [Halobellus rufus]
MSETDLKRSVRRGVALLLIPLSSSGLPEFVESALPGASAAFGLVAFSAALAYLLWSGLWQLSRAADTPF